MDRDIQKRIHGTANAISDSPVARERAAILAIVEELDIVISMAHDNFSQLEEKLSPVTEQSPESSEPVPDDDYLGSSPLYERLHGAVKTTRQLNTRLVRLKNRVEV